MLRLVFAAMVLFDHAFTLGGWNGGVGPMLTWTNGTESFGGLAVLGFFVISGFLVTRSFDGSPNPFSYLWKRFLRIFPGYWACLLVTVVLFAPLAYLYEHGALHGYVRGYADSPVHYVKQNFFLSMNQYGVNGLLGRNPFPHAFDGSLWTLIYEFKCYLGVLVLGIFGAFRRGRASVLVLSVVLWAMQLAQSLDLGLLKGAFVVGDPYMVRLAFIFTLGMLFYLYRDKVIVSGPLAILALVVFVVSLKTQSYYGIGEVMWAYLCIWAAVRLPFHHADRFGDFSYGLYIYAFVVQQMLVLYGVNAWGFVPYVVLSAMGTMVLAAASWFAVERPCLQLKALRVPWRRATSIDEASPFEQQPSRLGSKSSVVSRTVSLDSAHPSPYRDLPSRRTNVSAPQAARAEGDAPS